MIANASELASISSPPYPLGAMELFGDSSPTLSDKFKEVNVPLFEQGHQRFNHGVLKPQNISAFLKSESVYLVDFCSTKINSLYFIFYLL